MFLLSGSVRDPTPCYVHSANTAHRQYNQLPYPSTYKDFLFYVFVHPEEKAGHPSALLCSTDSSHSCFIMVHVCVTVIKVYAFLCSSNSSLPFPLN